MSEEEIEILEEFKELIYNPDYDEILLCTEDGFTGWHELFKNVLDLYNKEKELHKEYEDKFLKLLSSFNRLKELAETLRKENVELLIEKRQKELKIREKIKNLNKEYEEEYKNGQEWEIQDDIQAQISVLEELLEEE